MKATEEEEESKRSPTRRRLFGPVDHNQNKVDASLIWTNINPGFPRVEYSPRFRRRPRDTDRAREAGRDVEMEGDVDELDGGVPMDSSVETEEGYGQDESDQRRSTEVGQSAVNFDDSSNSVRNWNQSAGWAEKDKATTSATLAPLGGGRRPLPSERPGDDGRLTLRGRSDDDDPTLDDCSAEIDVTARSRHSATSIDAATTCRSRPATCPWRTLARVDNSSAFGDKGRIRSASLGQASRPSSSRLRSCRKNSPQLEPTYRKVPVVQLRGADVTAVSRPRERNYFFKPIAGGDETSAALRAASQSPDEGGDDEWSGVTRGPRVESRLQETVPESEATTDGVLEDAPAVGNCWSGQQEASKEEPCPVTQHQHHHQQNIRRRRRSIDVTGASLGCEKGEEEEEADDDNCRDRVAEDEDGRRADIRARPPSALSAGHRRIKDKLVTTPPKAKKRKPHESGNSDSPY